MRTIKDEVGIWQNESLTTLRSIKLFPIVLFLCWDRAWKIRIFLWLYKLTSIWFEEDFRGDIYDFFEQTMWNAAVNGVLLKWYKRNWYNTYGLSEQMKSFTVCVSFLSGILLFETSSTEGNDRSSESNVPMSNLILKKWIRSITTPEKWRHHFFWQWRLANSIVRGQI